MVYVAPTVRRSAFNCPHCRVLTTQSWYQAAASNLQEGNIPLIVRLVDLHDIPFDDIKYKAEREKKRRLFSKRAESNPFFGELELSTDRSVENVWFSSCHYCEKISIWIYNTLVYPHSSNVEPANPDMPEEVLRDYNEASAILDISPRGAAALARLAIQKLCMHLGQPGKRLDDDIAALVKSGIDVRVQQALDAVRIIGNNAVHPGQIDLRDDRAMAETLFKLLNIIVEKLITEPQRVNEIYDSLPSNALAAVEKRDSKK